MKKEQAIVKDIGSKTCIVALNDEMLAVGMDLLEEFIGDHKREKCKVVTKGEIIAEGYNAESGIHILKGADGKFYVIYSYAGKECGHDNKVIDILDNFEDSV
jgi:hypothetical protein